MLTIFSIPKPFKGHIGTIQRNALASWRRLQPTVRVVLLGQDDGIAEAAREFGCEHEPEITLNSYGTPLITDAFRRVVTAAHTPYLLYSNADMLFNDTLLVSVRALANLPNFICAGQRWDLDVTQDLTGASASTWDELFATHTTRGRLHGPAGIDYILFPRSYDLQMPDFAVGRVGWDSWLMWSTRQRRTPLVDATDDLVALHQNHDYTSLRGGYQHWRGPERDLNVRAAGGLHRMLTLREASTRLSCGKLLAPTGSRQIMAALATSSLYCRGLALKRSLQRIFH